MGESISSFLERASSELILVFSYFIGLIDSGSQLANRWDEESKFVYPLTLSLLAALIFWFVFNFLPYSFRRNKYRPIAEYDFWQVERKISLVLSSFLKIAPHGPTVFQNRFRAGDVSEPQIKIIIQNKCLSEAWLYDRDMPGELVPIGHEVRLSALEAERSIDKVLTLHEYIKRSEIILLEKARQCLKRLQFDEPYIDRPYNMIGKEAYLLAVSNLNAYSEVVYRLNCIHNEITSILFRFKSLESDQQFRFSKSLHLFYTDQYRKFIRFQRKIMKKYCERNFYSHYLIAMSRQFKFFTSTDLLEEYVSGKNRPAKFDGSLLKLYKECEAFRIILKGSYSEQDIREQIIILKNKKI